MAFFFSIETDADRSCALHAKLAPCQLDIFLAQLRADGQRLGAPLFNDGCDLGAMLHDGFEARVCPIPIERIAPLFGNDPAVITVIENARSRARKITIWRERPPLRANAVPPEGPILICPAMTSDTDAEMELPSPDALKLLLCLGLDDWTKRCCSANHVRRALAEPAIHEQIAAEGLAHVIPDLERLLATADGDPTARLLWV